MSQQSYVFRWSNYNLDRYLEARRSVAKAKRREAEILAKQAEAIENEIDELEGVLIPQPEEHPAND